MSKSKITAVEGNHAQNSSFDLMLLKQLLGLKVKAFHCFSETLIFSYGAAEMNGNIKLKHLCVCCVLSGVGGQRLRAGSGLVGFGCGDVRDDVRPPAVLQPGPREAVRAHSHGGDQVPTNPVGRRQVAAVGPPHQGPQQTVRSETLSPGERGVLQRGEGGHRLWVCPCLGHSDALFWFFLFGTTGLVSTPVVTADRSVLPP